MIVDGEFLAQEDVAEMVLTLSSDNTSRLLNGRVVLMIEYSIPSSRRSLLVQGTDRNHNVGTVVISTSTTDSFDLSRIKALCQSLVDDGQRKIIIVSPEKIEQLSEYPHYRANLLIERDLIDCLNRIRNSLGPINGLIHFTGQLDYSKSLLELSKQDWDSLIDRFIYIPALVTKHTVTTLAPDGALEEPIKFKESAGNVVIVGPDWPKGEKISGLIKARAELFRGCPEAICCYCKSELPMF